jgi:hypothetical protein
MSCVPVISLAHLTPDILALLFPLQAALTVMGVRHLFDPQTILDLEAEVQAAGGKLKS